eukprot:TRINITY_DN11698_c0_g1_i1.p1 TRINITY_DN11698_c0_g1~~TRINITY_DN11698_c0_g1_i1.p1  ORF type:complete len:220 (+),score=43.21 TRINITY_DN11698_c0_g1_i1:55-660(+)
MFSHPKPALRNRGPIVDKLKELFAGDLGGSVLEIASGTGAHLEVMKEEWKETVWQPTEYDKDKLEWLRESFKDSTNVRKALHVDAALPGSEWGVPEGSQSIVYCANVTHISPWEVTQGIIAGSSWLLTPTGSLLIYGPFKVNNEFTTQSNADFDTSLRSQDPSWGYRDISELEKVAATCGLSLKERHVMPANNFLLRFVRA